MSFLKLSITTSNKFRFTLVFDKTYPSSSALIHFAINIFSIYCTPKSKKGARLCYCISKAFNLNLNKAFGEGYVISKIKVKPNLIMKQHDTILTKE